MKSIILVLPYPPSANRYWQSRVMNSKSAGGRPMATTYISAEAKKYKKDVKRLAREAGCASPITGRVQLDIRLYPHRPLDWEKRKRQLGDAWSDTVQCIDLGNAEKVLSDALKDIVMEDDKWIRKIVSERMEPDDLGSRVVVRVMSMSA